MTKNHRGFVATALALALGSCSDTPAPTACAVQADCGGGQVCVAGECVSGNVSTYVNTSAFAQSAQCPDGGVDIESGIDRNANGTLDADEVTETRTVCNGAQGAAGLVTTAIEPAGMACPGGGVRIDAGTDANGDGALAPDELASTQVVCNGDAGDPGMATLLDSSDEPAGANCVAGGVRIDIGPDRDGNGQLDTAEVMQTKYVCHGAEGAISLVATSTEAAGANCPQGGIRVDSGVDTDGDGALDPAR